jgi:hypothetical protein
MPCDQGKLPFAMVLVGTGNDCPLCRSDVYVEYELKSASNR